MANKEALKKQVCEAIDSRRDRVVGVGESIMDAPELGFKEVRTAKCVQEVFDEAGLPYEKDLALTGV